MLNIAVIADDLTGANDSGVQFVRAGHRAVVALREDALDTGACKAVIYNTDSRAVSPEEAYRRTLAIATRIAGNQARFVYKKMDSTMRGNVGAEFDAIYDALDPRFIFFTPAYPRNGRIVKDGYLRVGGRNLHETEFANDPTSPMTESYIPAIVEAQSMHKVGIVGTHDVKEGTAALLSLLHLYDKEGRKLILFDAETDEDLHRIAEAAGALPFHVVWAGSAGLAQALLPSIPDRPRFEARPIGASVLAVVGSVHPKSRRQKRYALERSNVIGLEMSLTAAIGSDHDRRLELDRILRLAHEALTEKRDLLLYAAGDRADVEWMKTRGLRYGLNPKQISDRISETFGMAASMLVRHGAITKVVLTGGDIAASFCTHADIRGFELIDEAEPGIPIGRLIGDREIYAITKAGGFGSDHALARAIALLKGEETT